MWAEHCVLSSANGKCSTAPTDSYLDLTIISLSETSAETVSKHTNTNTHKNIDIFNPFEHLVLDIFPFYPMVGHFYTEWFRWDMAIGHTGHGRMFSNSDLREDAALAAHTYIICPVVCSVIRYLMRADTTHTRFWKQIIIRMIDI